MAREHEALAKRLETLNAKLAAASLFMPPQMKAALAVDGEGDEEGGGPNRGRKWAPTILSILGDSKYGLTTADLMQRLEGHPLEQDVGPYGGALYNAMRKMIGRGEITKKGDYYCLPWQTKPPTAPEHDRGSIRPAILRIISERGPIKSADILSYLMSNDPAIASGMKRSTGAFYKSLSVLIRDGKIIKEGKLYRVPSKENEPSDGGASDGSDAGSVGARSGVFG